MYLTRRFFLISATFRRKEAAKAVETPVAIPLIKPIPGDGSAILTADAVKYVGTATRALRRISGNSGGMGKIFRLIPQLRVPARRKENSVDAAEPTMPYFGIRTKFKAILAAAVMPAIYACHFDWRAS